jgi:hypothetical protein
MKFGTDVVSFGNFCETVLSFVAVAIEVLGVVTEHCLAFYS